MRARVINYPAGPVVAFGGCEFVNYEWRDVPSGAEGSAQRHPFLEVEVVAELEPEAPPEIAEPEPKPKPKPKRKATTTRRKRATKAKDDK